jgi:hypothetical protein
MMGLGYQLRKQRGKRPLPQSTPAQMFYSLVKTFLTHGKKRSTK